jgi:plastocyanin
MRALAAALLVMTACTEHGQTPPFDAKPKPGDAPVVVVDANSVTVVEVTPCPGTVAATVTTTDAAFMFMPSSTTIIAGDTVKFVMSPTHNVGPAVTMSDPGLNVGFGATKCLMFTQPGTFQFRCVPHGETGTITAIVTAD